MLASVKVGDLLRNPILVERKILRLQPCRIAAVLVGNSNGNKLGGDGRFPLLARESYFLLGNIQRPLRLRCRGNFQHLGSRRSGLLGGRHRLRLPLWPLPLPARCLCCGFLGSKDERGEEKEQRDERREKKALSCNHCFALHVYKHHKPFW